MKNVIYVILIMGCLLSSDQVRAQEKKEKEPSEPGKPQGELIFLRDFGSDEVGYLAIPQLVPKAGLVVAHGKYGMNVNTRLLCDRLARDGYLVLAVDLFNGRIPTSPGDLKKNQQGYSMETSVTALETGIHFFNLSPRFKMDKVILVGIGESSKEVLAVAAKDRSLSGLTMLEPEVLPNEKLMAQIGVPIQVFVSSGRHMDFDLDAVNAGKSNRLMIRRMPRVWTDDEKKFKRVIDERVWAESKKFWDALKVPERSLTEKLIETVF